MKRLISRAGRRALLVILLLGGTAQAQRASGPIELRVDLTDAADRIFHARLSMPVEPGPLELVYPKWIPGEHGPTGPITDLVGLRFFVNGTPLAWERNAREMFEFGVQVPPGAERLDIELDYLSPGGSGQFTAGAATSDQLAVMSWNTLLLYPQGSSIHDQRVRPSLVLPPTWDAATALTQDSREGNVIRYREVSLAELVDSPVATGAHHRVIDLTGDAAVPHRLHLVADSEAALAIQDRTEQGLKRLVAEANDLFGAYHYRKYDFLLTLSDHVASFGLEHHESSDDRVLERALIDDTILDYAAYLLPHEYVHSWNAKYRRPAGLTRDDFQEPFESDLLWVYEGLTEYLGEVLTTRSGLWTPDYAHDLIALDAAYLSDRAGREWRPLADTTRAAQLLYGARDEGSALRRGVDFYDEGLLLWLEVDAQIRALTRGRRSLDDFCRAFYGGPSGGAPRVVPFTYEDLVAALGDVADYDWRAFFDARVYSVRADAPTSGLEAAGWRVEYTAEPNVVQAAADTIYEQTDLRFSLGVTLGTSDGYVVDVLPGSPAAAAGLASGTTLVAVNGRRWSPDLVREALEAAVDSAEPIRLLVENDEFFSEIAVDYHDGPRYPHLVRITDSRDVLSEILEPRTYRR